MISRTLGVHCFFSSLTILVTVFSLDCKLLGQGSVQSNFGKQKKDVFRATLRSHSVAWILIIQSHTPRSLVA